MECGHFLNIVCVAFNPVEIVTTVAIIRLLGSCWSHAVYIQAAASLFFPRVVPIVAPLLMGPVCPISRGRFEESLIIIIIIIIIRCS